MRQTSPIFEDLVRLPGTEAIYPEGDYTPRELLNRFREDGTARASLLRKYEMAQKYANEGNRPDNYVSQAAIDDCHDGVPELVVKYCDWIVREIASMFRNLEVPEDFPFPLPLQSSLVEVMQKIVIYRARSWALLENRSGADLEKRSKTVEKLREAEIQLMNLLVDVATLVGVKKTRDEIAELRALLQRSNPELSATA